MGSNYQLLYRLVALNIAVISATKIALLLSDRLQTKKPLSGPDGESQSNSMILAW
jgi:hypothetical protein